MEELLLRNFSLGGILSEVSWDMRNGLRLNSANLISWIRLINEKLRLSSWECADLVHCVVSQRMRRSSLLTQWHSYRYGLLEVPQRSLNELWGIDVHSMHVARVALHLIEEFKRPTALIEGRVGLNAVRNRGWEYWQSRRLMSSSVSHEKTSRQRSLNEATRRLESLIHPIVQLLRYLLRSKRALGGTWRLHSEVSPCCLSRNGITCSRHLRSSAKIGWASKGWLVAA